MALERLEVALNAMTNHRPKIHTRTETGETFVSMDGGERLMDDVTEELRQCARISESAYATVACFISVRRDRLHYREVLAQIRTTICGKFSEGALMEGYKDTQERCRDWKSKVHALVAVLKQMRRDRFWSRSFSCALPSPSPTPSPE